MARSRKPVSAVTKAKISAALVGNKNAFQGGPKQRIDKRTQVSNINARTKAKVAAGLLTPEQAARRQAVAKRLRHQARRDEALGKGPGGAIPQVGSTPSGTSPNPRRIKTHADETVRRSSKRTAAEKSTSAKNTGVQARVATREKTVDAAIHSQSKARGSSPEHDRFLNDLESQGVKITGGSKKRVAQRRAAGTSKPDKSTGLAGGGADRSRKSSIQSDNEPVVHDHRGSRERLVPPGKARNQRVSRIFKNDSTGSSAVIPAGMKGTVAKILAGEVASASTAQLNAAKRIDKAVRVGRVKKR